MKKRDASSVSYTQQQEMLYVHCANIFYALGSLFFTYKQLITKLDQVLIEKHKESIWSKFHELLVEDKLAGMVMLVGFKLDTNVL